MVLPDDEWEWEEEEVMFASKFTVHVVDRNLVESSFDVLFFKILIGRDQEVYLCRQQYEGRRLHICIVPP